MGISRPPRVTLGVRDQFLNIFHGNNGEMCLKSFFAGRGNHAFHAELLTFAESPLERRDRADFAAEAHFAKGDEISPQRFFFVGARDRERDGEVSCRLTGFETADHVNMNVILGKVESGSALKYGREDMQAVYIKAAGFSLWVAKDGFIHKGLDFDEEGPGALHEAGHHTPGHGVATLGEEGRGRIWHFNESAFSHVKDADLVSGTEAIFDGAHEPEFAVRIAFKVEHRINEVLERFGRRPSLLSSHGR